MLGSGPLRQGPRPIRVCTRERVGVEQGGGGAARVCGSGVQFVCADRAADAEVCGKLRGAGAAPLAPDAAPACSSAATKEHMSHLRADHTQVTETDPSSHPPSSPLPLPSRPPQLFARPSPTRRSSVLRAHTLRSPLYHAHTYGCTPTRMPGLNRDRTACAAGRLLLCLPLSSDSRASPAPWRTSHLVHRRLILHDPHHVRRCKSVSRHAAANIRCVYT